MGGPIQVSHDILAFASPEFLRSVYATMSDRAFLFLFSLGVLIAALGVAGWLIATDQVGTIDGLFLFCTCMVIALTFGLYLRWLVRSTLHDAHRRPEKTKLPSQRTRSSAEATPVLSDVR